MSKVGNGKRYKKLIHSMPNGFNGVLAFKGYSTKYKG